MAWHSACLAQSVRNPWYAPPAIQGTDDFQTQALPAKRPNQGKGRGGKQSDRSQVPQRKFPPDLKLWSSYLEVLQGHDDPRCLWIPFRTEVSSRAQSPAERHPTSHWCGQATRSVHGPMLASPGHWHHHHRSPLDTAGQPGACIVTAVLQAGFASSTCIGGIRNPDISRHPDLLRSRHGGSPQWTNVWPISFPYRCAGSV